MPKSVTILGRKIPIKYLPQTEMDKLIPGAMGIWESSYGVIFISKSYCPKAQKNTLKHEVGHALLCFTGLDQVLSRELQEIIVQSYASLIEDVLAEAQRYR